MKKNFALISFVLICIISTLMVGAAQFNATAAPLASHVAPVFVPGNPSCPPGTIELKVEPAIQGDPIVDGTYSDGVLTVTIDVRDTADGQVFDFTANIGIDVVIAKGGSNANVYTYVPDVTSDTGLHAPLNTTTYFDLSHISFCYDIEPPTNTPTPTDTPTNTPTNTPTDTPTNTPTDTPTNTPTDTPTNTPTNTPAADLGQLKVCKVAGAGVPVGTLFTITVNGTSYSVPAGPDNGYCVLAGQFPLNTQLTIQEVIPAGYIVARIEVKPDGRTVSKNVSLGTVVVKMGTGVTEVIFTNRVPTTPTATPQFTATPKPTRTPGAPTPTPAPTGRLQICKEADGEGVSGYFTFTFA